MKPPLKRTPASVLESRKLKREAAAAGMTDNAAVPAVKKARTTMLIDAHGECSLCF